MGRYRRRWGNFYILDADADGNLTRAVLRAARDDLKARVADARAQFKAADTNGDGKWSKTEWLDAGMIDQTCVTLDANKDGFVSQAEVTALKQKGTALL